MIQGNTTRRIFKTAFTGSGIIKELLQMIFVSELLYPSEKDIWIVTGWISDIPLIDNTDGGFDSINPYWRGRYINLIEVLIQILSNNSKINIVTNNDDHNIIFHDRIQERVRELSLNNNLIMTNLQPMHAKGIITDHGVLLGSMNITKSGNKSSSVSSVSM